MTGNEVTTLSFWSVAIIISIVLLFIVAQISRFYAMFQQHRKEIEADLIGLTGQMKQMQNTLNDLLTEERRLVRLQAEMADLKRAEMTGDFEILEEPIEEPPQLPPAEAPAPATPANAFPQLNGDAPKNGTKREFPKLNIG